eukprot:16450413-Heterocapsa_arctica.AAC.1
MKRMSGLRAPRGSGRLHSRYSSSSRASLFSPCTMPASKAAWMMTCRFARAAFRPARLHSRRDAGRPASSRPPERPLL